MTSILAAEGGYQEFELLGGEWAILAFSGLAALVALGVGFLLMRGVLAADQGTPKMIEIALAIQEGAWAYLKRQFKTIGVILIPLAAIVFVTSTEIAKPDGTEALSFVQSGLFRTIAFVAGGFLSGLTGYIGMTLATRGNVRTAAAAKRNSLPDALKVAFRTGGIAGMFTVGLGLLGAVRLGDLRRGDEHDRGQRDEDHPDGLELALEVRPGAFLDRECDLDHLRSALIRGEDASHQEEADADGDEGSQAGEGEDGPFTSEQLELLVAALGGQDAGHACFLWVLGAALRPLVDVVRSPFW